MSILQNLKMLNKPISELAMLDQTSIMQMAQTGQIPAEYVAPILSEKARLAQAGANAAAMAQAQQAPTSIVEQLMAQNAASDAQNSGIGALPVAEDMYQGPSQEFAGGGIVAFAEGDLVGDPTGIEEYLAGYTDPMAGAAGEDVTGYRDALKRLGLVAPAAPAAPTVAGVSRTPRPGLGSEQDYINQVRAFQKAAGYDYDAIKKAEEARIAKQESELGAQRNQDAWLAALQAGLSIMGGESPYAFANIGKGAQAGAEAYGKSTKEYRAAQKDLSKARSEMAKAEQLDKKGLAEQAMGLREAAAKREESALDRMSRENIANAPPDAIRGAKAIQLPGETLDAALGRYADAVANKDQYNAAAGLVQAAYKGASEKFSNSVKAGGANYLLAAAAGGNADALKKLKITQEQAKKDLAAIEQQYYEAAYSGIGMDPATANQYLRAPKKRPGTPTSSTGGDVDKNNPLLK